MDRPLDRRREDERLDKINDRLDALSSDVSSILHGNGRAGIRKIADAVFGHRDAPQEPGLVVRVKRIEERDREAVWLRRGVVIGVGLVAADSLLGVNLAAVLRGLFGS